MNNPLTEPTVRPAAMYRCAAMSSMAAGSRANTASAIASPQFCENSPT
jgi:hypothetical protein